MKQQSSQSCIKQIENIIKSTYLDYGKITDKNIARIVNIIKIKKDAD